MHAATTDHKELDCVFTFSQKLQETVLHRLWQLTARVEFVAILSITFSGIIGIPILISKITVYLNNRLGQPTLEWFQCTYIGHNRLVNHLKPSSSLSCTCIHHYCCKKAFMRSSVHVAVHILIQEEDLHVGSPFQHFQLEMARLSTLPNTACPGTFVNSRTANTVHTGTVAMYKDACPGNLD